MSRRATPGIAGAPMPAYDAPVASQLPRRIIGGGAQLPSPDPRIEIAVLRIEEVVDSLPVAKLPIQVALVYPRELLRAGITGDATVLLSVEKDGTVSGVWPMHASQQEFADAVEPRIRKYVFVPATHGGSRIRCSAVCKVTFSIHED